jgi:hypothetical protein
MYIDQSTLFEQVKLLNVEYYHYQSDLYLPCTEKSKKLVEQYEFANNVTKFISHTDNRLYYDIPFAYDPFWENKVLHNKKFGKTHYEIAKDIVEAIHKDIKSKE